MLLKIAVRNILRQKRRTLLTALTMVGGFTLASISIAWQDGAYNDIIDNFTRTRLGHIQIHADEYLDHPSLHRNIARVSDLGQVLDGFERLESWAPRVFSSALASVGEKTTGVRVIGIDPEREAATTRFRDKVVEGGPLPEEPRHQALLGRGLARRLSAGVGDEVVLLSQGADGSMANDIYEIVGLVESGDQATDLMSIYLHLADAQELLVLEGRVHELVVVAESPKRLFRLARDIAAEIDRDDVAVEPWQVFARSFYEAMKTDQQGNWISIFIIVLVVSVGVLNTVLMSVLERRQEYGLLRAMGTRPRQVFSLVVTEVFVLALASVITATVVSLGLNYWLSHQGISLSQELTLAGVEFREMYAEINVRSYVIPAIVVVASAMLVGLFPAVKAARTPPAAAMRTI